MKGIWAATEAEKVATRAAFETCGLKLAERQSSAA
jgi:hypothetical protein